MTARAETGWAVFLRHQAASVVATAVDFGTMIALVELLALRPDVATLIGASAGAVTNFTVGRTWAFKASDAPIGAQAARYALVSALSAVWNALGEHVLARRLGAPYVLARVVVALVVSVAWNFPAHRHFVFKKPRAVPPALSPPVSPS
ncbi:MAG: GtrA family protein [Polyangiaceae bacterium]